MRAVIDETRILEASRHGGEDAIDKAASLAGRRRCRAVWQLRPTTFFFNTSTTTSGLEKKNGYLEGAGQVARKKLGWEPWKFRGVGEDVSAWRPGGFWMD